MKRTALRRSVALRSRRRDTRPRPPRLGVAVPDGPGWSALCRAIRRRDQVCRFCGAVPPPRAVAWPVDHILPRRLLPVCEADARDNLAVLCSAHHSVKTGRIESRLFAYGDWYELWRWIETLALTGPVPSAELVGRALQRLNALLGGEVNGGK